MKACHCYWAMTLYLYVIGVSQVRSKKGKRPLSSRAPSNECQNGWSERQKHWVLSSISNSQKNRVDLWKWKWHQSIVVPMQGWCDPWSIWWHYWLIKISTSMVEVNHNVSKKENTISVSGDSTLYKLWLESTPSLKILDSLWSHKLQHFHQKSVLGIENIIFWWKDLLFLVEKYNREIVQKLCPWKINGIPFPRSLEGRQHFLKERERRSKWHASNIDRSAADPQSYPFSDKAQ